MRRQKTFHIFSVLALACFSNATQAGTHKDEQASSWSLSAGKGEGVVVTHLSHRQSGRLLRSGADWGLSLNHDIGLGAWRGPTGLDVYDVSYTPTLRMTRGTTLGFDQFVEGGIGVHLLTRTRASDEKRFSTAFQFGEYIRSGIRMGGNLEIAYGIYHVSNARIKRPNSGLTYTGLSVTYSFN